MPSEAAADADAGAGAGAVLQSSSSVKYGGSAVVTQQEEILSGADRNGCCGTRKH